VIAIEINKGLEAPTLQNQTGVWTFIVTHAKGVPLHPNKENHNNTFIEEGPWEEARARAAVRARTYGCVDDVDSIILVWFTPA
jgi:hypothetical protein